MDLVTSPGDCDVIRGASLSFFLLFLALTVRLSHVLEVSVSSHYLPSVHLTRYDYEWEWIGTPLSPPLHFLRYCQKEQTDGWKMLGGGLLGINEYGVGVGEEREGQGSDFSQRRREVRL